jgi:hypothetical protein
LQVTPSSGGSPTEQEGKADIDDIITNIGGVGRYQVQWSIILVLGMVSGAFVNYSLYYFTLNPVYECLLPGETGWISCTTDHFCYDDKVRKYWKIKVDFSDNRSIHNWMEQYDLTC